MERLYCIYTSFSYCSLWRPFSKAIVCSSFRLECKVKTQRKVCAFYKNDMKTYSCEWGLILMISSLMVSSKIVKVVQNCCYGSSIESFTRSSPSEQIIAYVQFKVFTSKLRLDCSKITVNIKTITLA